VFCSSQDLLAFLLKSRLLRIFVLAKLRFRHPFFCISVPSVHNFDSQSKSDHCARNLYRIGTNKPTTLTMSPTLPTTPRSPKNQEDELKSRLSYRTLWLRYPLLSLPFLPWVAIDLGLSYWETMGDSKSKVIKWLGLCQVHPCPQVRLVLLSNH
jgi:hypothetical protein